ncbi:MAG: hypothetical protein FWH46_01680 [Methanimicrococcus sp.]|nr:hypothetical protein [Methanimicrococcus sp.]
MKTKTSILLIVTMMLVTCLCAGCLGGTDSSSSRNSSSILADSYVIGTWSTQDDQAVIYDNENQTSGTENLTITFNKSNYTIKADSCNLAGQWESVYISEYSLAQYPGALGYYLLYGNKGTDEAIGYAVLYEKELYVYIVDGDLVFSAVTKQQ